MRIRSWLAVTLLASAACGGSRDELLADLQNARPDVRARAVKRLAKQGRPDDLVLFTRAAKDLSAAVRAEAASALGGSQDARVVDLLGELLEDGDEDVQSRAALALSELRSDKARAYLTLQYARRGQRTREVIVQALARAQVPSPLAHVVAAESRSLWSRSTVTLKEGSTAERVAAAEQLGKSGRPEAVEQLLPLLRDSQVVVAAAAARGLGSAQDGRAVGPIALLLDENFPELREAASEALGALRDPVAVERLEAVALERSSASLAATQAVVSMPPSARAQAALCAISREGAASESRVAGQVMRSRGGCPLEPLTSRLARPATAPGALVALAGLGPAAKAALSSVLPLLGSSDGATRALAAEAVAEMGDPSALGALRRACDAERARVEALRADWVAKPLPRAPQAGLEAGSATPQAALMEKVRQVNAAKARAAGQPPPPEAGPPGELVDDASLEQLRPLAALLRALGTVGGEPARKSLEPLLQDSHPELRRAALVGLARSGASALPAAMRGMALLDQEGQAELARAVAGQGEAGQRALVEALPSAGTAQHAALGALREMGAPVAAADTLVSIVKGGGPDAPLAAAVLGKMKAHGAVAPLLALLEQPAPAGLEEILGAVGAQGERSAARAVARSLFHDSPEVRVASIRALAAIGTPEQAEALEALRGDYYRSVRSEAERALTAVRMRK